MSQKISIIIIITSFILACFFLVPREKFKKVDNVISPCEIIIDSGEYILKNYDCFDAQYSQKNIKLAKNFGITEDKAFILGNIGKYWASNLIKGRTIYLNKNNDIIFYKYNYTEKFKNTAFCIENNQPCTKDNFEFFANKIDVDKYCVIDLDTDKVYSIGDKNIKSLNNFLVLKKFHLGYKDKTEKNVLHKTSNSKTIKKPPMKFYYGNIKVFLTDFTSKLKPDNKCNTDVCVEILNSINNAKNSIDIAIYGYQNVHLIEKAIISAINRGVNVRMICDSNSKGENIYENTEYLKSIIKKNNTDLKSLKPDYIMHNKFYIFDDKILITGSTNLSPTDMSGFNSNTMLVINSKEVANIYKQEFEQMLSGKFHQEKEKIKKTNLHINNNSDIQIGFSPKDKITQTMIIPLINQSKKYIYIPSFFLTDKTFAQALINAKNRNVEIRIIEDALSASNAYSSHHELRKAGIAVKIENYAGKMHSKSIIIDDLYTIIGSMNFTKSGENKNDENVVIIKNPEIAKFYKEFFLYQWNKIDNKWLKYNAPAEGKATIGSCSDGIDNNYDGKTDMEDVRCK